MEFHMRPCSSHLRQDKLELEYAQGKAARMIKSQSKKWLNSLGLTSLENTWLRGKRSVKGWLASMCIVTDCLVSSPKQDLESTKWANSTSAFCSGRVTMWKDTKFKELTCSGGDWIRKLSFLAKQNAGYKNWCLGFSRRLQILSSCSWAGEVVKGLLQYTDVPIMSPAAK